MSQQRFNTIDRQCHSSILTHDTPVVVVRMYIVVQWQHLGETIQQIPTVRLTQTFVKYIQPIRHKQRGVILRVWIVIFDTTSRFSTRKEENAAIGLARGARVEAGAFQSHQGAAFKG